VTQTIAGPSVNGNGNTFPACTTTSGATSSLASRRSSDAPRRSMIDGELRLAVFFARTAGTPPAAGLRRPARLCPAARSALTDGRDAMRRRLSDPS